MRWHITRERSSHFSDRLPEGRPAEGKSIDDLLAELSAIFERWVEEGKLKVTPGAADLLE